MNVRRPTEADAVAVTELAREMEARFIDESEVSVSDLLVATFLEKELSP